MPLQPLPNCGSGAGGDAVDVEQFLLCDLDAEGNLLGTALAVYEYDSEGNPTGAPTFVDPATGNPYVPQGTLQPCPDAACLPPVQFCQTSTSTGPVEHPGRQYDITLPINPGFAVQSLQVDAVSNPAGITWEVDDPDGEAFRQNLTTFIEGRVPAAATVTITNPNAGVPQVCGAAQPMTVHIECIRLDQSPPNLIELVYNGGQDLIQNPAYNESPALNPPVSQGNYGFRLLSRQDDPGPFPGNQPANDALCTSVGNRGWETNDVGRTFEIWGQDIVNGSNVTPTPRGTPVQEMTSDGPPPGGRSTIWQTFQAPASGNFIIRVVHGARDPGEQHRITLDNGDTDATQNGDLIDDISNPPSVTNSGGPNPWTQFSQTIPLNGGSTYTLALSTNNPAGGARGGLFTDMRAYIDRPDLRATAATDDDTCVVTTDETTTNTTCSYWQPQCVGGAIAGWQKVDTGETMTNAEFWAQVPTPTCCLPDGGGEGGASSTLSNMLTSDLVCATVGGIAQNAIRVVVTDPSGGTLQEQFLGSNGAPVAPESWTAGPCTGSRFMADQVLCDDNGPFLRKYVQSLDPTNQAQVNSFRDFTLSGAGYTPVGTVGTCAPSDCRDTATVLLCDAPADDITTVSPAITDGTVADVGQGQFTNLPGAYAALWNGASLNWPATAGPGQQYPMAVGRLTANPAGCDGADGDLTVSVRVAQNGPGTGQAWDGALRIFRGTTLLADAPVRTYAPPGWVQTLTATVPVTAADLAAGDIRVGLVLETFHGTAKAWTADQFSATVDLVGCDATSAVQFLRTLVTDCETGDVVSTTDTDLEGNPYVVTGEVGQCTTVAPSPDNGGDTEVLALCDDGTATPTPFVRRITFDEAGVVASIVDTDLDGTPYIVAGNAVVCGGTDAAADTEAVALCDFTGDPPVITVTAVGQPPAPAGDAPLPPVAEVNDWVSGASPTLVVPTWGTNPPTPRRFNVQYEVQPPGAAPCGPPTTVHVKHTFSVRNTGEGSPGSGTVSLLLRNGGATVDSQTIGAIAAGSTVQVTLEADVPYADLAAGNIDVHHSYLVWQPTIHPSYQVSNYSMVVTDVAADPSCITAEFVQFLRHFVYAADGTIASHYDTTLEGSLYEVTGTVGVCQPDAADTGGSDEELLVLCDSTPTRFLRRYNYDSETGAFLGFVNTTLDGSTPFAPVGTVGVCTTAIASDFDFLSTVLCDANGTQFIQRLTFNSATGAVTATTNTTLTGAAFAPVAPIGLCSNCCPQVIGSGCTNTGSGFYTAVRATNGTISLIDSVTGAAVLAANIVPCPSDNTVRALTAQARQLTNATPWTPGADVAGTLTSLTVTGTGGLWDMVDANGTALTGLPAGLTLTWEAEDDNTLTGPQSVTPQAGASVVAHWTQR